MGNKMYAPKEVIHSARNILRQKVMRDDFIMRPEHRTKLFGASRKALCHELEKSDYPGNNRPKKRRYGIQTDTGNPFRYDTSPSREFPHLIVGKVRCSSSYEISNERHIQEVRQTARTNKPRLTSHFSIVKTRKRFIANAANITVPVTILSITPDG